MMLNLAGFEFEVRGDSFVCIDDGAKSHFCEWQYLDPKLQDAFSTLKKEVTVALERFLMSGDMSAFESTAEHYGHNCRAKAV